MLVVLVCWWWESEGGPMPLFRRPGAGAVGEICGGSLTRIRRHRPPLSYSQHHHTLCTHIPHAYMHTCKHTKQISIMHCMSLRGRRCYSRLLRFWWPSEDAQFDHSLSSLCSAASQCRAAQSGSLPRGWAGQASRWRWSSFHTCLSHSNVGSKDFTWGLMWIQRLVLHPSSDKAFSQILTQKIGQGPSMDSTLGTASRHHDKILQCDYFDAKCCQRSLKRFEKVLHKKNKSKSSKLLFNVRNFTMSCFKSIVMIS